MPTGSPVVQSDPSGDHDYVFSWNGSIAANLFQSQKAISDLIAAQIANGDIDSGSSATVDPTTNTVTLNINKSVAFITVTVSGTGTLTSLAPAQNATGFQLTGTVDAGGLGSAGQVKSQLVQWVGQWESQAQQEPPQAPSAGFGGLAA